MFCETEQQREGHNTVIVGQQLMKQALRLVLVK